MLSLLIFSAVIILVLLALLFAMKRLEKQQQTLGLTRRELEEKERFQQLAEATFEGILVHENNRIINANQALVALFSEPSLRAVQVAVADVATATEKFPDVLDAVQRAIANANRVIAAYGEDSGFNTDLRALMRRLRDTAGAFEALGRTLERNPQSLLLGR